MVVQDGRRKLTIGQRTFKMEGMIEGAEVLGVAG